MLCISGSLAPICTTFSSRKQFFAENWRNHLPVWIILLEHPRNPCCFYAEPVRNRSAAYLLAESPLKCWRKKQVPAAICITFHTNFTIRPGGHSTFRRFPSAARRPRSAFRKYQFVALPTFHLIMNSTSKKSIGPYPKYCCIKLSNRS